MEVEEIRRRLRLDFLPELIGHIVIDRHGYPGQEWEFYPYEGRQLQPDQAYVLCESSRPCGIFKYDSEGYFSLLPCFFEKMRLDAYPYAKEQGQDSNNSGEWMSIGRLIMRSGFPNWEWKDSLDITECLDFTEWMDFIAHHPQAVVEPNTQVVVGITCENGLLFSEWAADPIFEQEEIKLWLCPA